MDLRLERLCVRGFRSIAALDDGGFGVRPLHVLIGANGAGKSNLVGFLRFLSAMLGQRNALADFVARSGGANAILHDGAKVSPELEGALSWRRDGGCLEYEFRLGFGAGDSLVFLDERYRLLRTSAPADEQWKELAPNGRESALHSATDARDPAAALITAWARRCTIHHFHDTSATARLRTRCRVSDGLRLKTDGENLAAVLLRLRTDQLPYYHRIVDSLRLVLPFFEDFVLEPEHDTVLLRWRERDSDIFFDASQGSDGMLRLFCLTTLLLQPEKDLGDLLVIDEPELGLHPAAIDLLTGLVHAAKQQVPLILATQSPTVVDAFEAEDVVVVERNGRASSFRRLDTPSLAEWLERYSLSELWEKNVLGGRPGA